MTRPFLSLTLFVIPLCIITAGCHPSDTKDLQLKLNPQENKTYQLSLVKTTATQYWEKLFSDTLRLEGQFSLEKRNDSLVLMRFYFSKLEIKTPGGKAIVIDSMRNGSRRLRNTSLTEERDAMLNLLKGMSLSVILTNKGEVQQVDDLDKITDSLSAISKVEVSGVRLLLRDYLAGDAFKDIFNSIFYILPGKEVVQSERWTHDYILTTKVPVKLSNLFTLEADDNDTATIRIHALISASTGEGGRVYMKGKQDGYARISRESGLPFYRETSSDIITETKHYDEARKAELTINTKEKLTLIVKPVH